MRSLWRFFAGDENPEHMTNSSNCGVYDVNTLANYDPDILPFLHAVYGNRFERDDSGEFRQLRADE